jgi:hypothetical protein
MRITSRSVRLLHRLLHRFFKVLIDDLQAMFLGDGFGVPDPSTDDVRRDYEIAWKR